MFFRFAHNAGRVLFEGVGVIAIDGGSVALKLNVGRDGDGFPGGIVEVGLEEIERPFLGVVNPVDFPIAIEEVTEGGFHALFCQGTFFCGEGHFDGMGRHLVDAEDALVFPVVCRE